MCEECWEEAQPTALGKGVKIEACKGCGVIALTRPYGDLRLCRFCYRAQALLPAPEDVRLASKQRWLP